MTDENSSPNNLIESKAVPASCVKFSKEEHEQIAQDAKFSGKSIPTLLKSAYFPSRRVRVLMSKEDQDRWFRELRAWGNNVNQLARRVNSGLEAGWQDEIEPIRQAILRIQNLILGTYGSRNI